MDLEAMLYGMTHHKPTPEATKQIEHVREEFKGLAVVINMVCLDSPELDAANKKLREALMWAVAAIVLNNGSED